MARLQPTRTAGRICAPRSSGDEEVRFDGIASGYTGNSGGSLYSTVPSRCHMCVRKRERALHAPPAKLPVLPPLLHELYSGLSASRVPCHHPSAQSAPTRPASQGAVSFRLRAYTPSRYSTDAWCDDTVYTAKYSHRISVCGYA